jgi:hypothetical protein
VLLSIEIEKINFEYLMEDKPMADDRKALIGTWRMVKRISRDAQGLIIPPAPEPKGWHAISMGLITFNLAGRVMSVLCDGRTRTADSPQRLPRDYSADCGSYSFDGTTLLMRIDASTPDRLGTDQLRKVRFEEGLLVLMPPPVTIDGIQVQREIYWERISIAAA